ncbi:MAG: SagB/ThcOx family dehydrogenase [Halanaerobiales bacterium]|nr:SagB/ThcOx family dehydrogenase [Halanaerobiales bacterium]
MKKQYKKLREFLKSTEWVNRDKLMTPKDEGKKRPAPIKEYDKEAELIELPDPKELKLKINSIKKVFNKRKSRREFSKKYLSKNELSYLLWSTQGLRGNNLRFRTVPSGGAVHPFETYLIVRKVNNLKEGLYRYIPDKNSLLFIKTIEDIKNKIIESANGQKFVGDAAVVFYWTVIPKRGEYKYGTLAHKLAAIDVGHLCQNLYLASESIKTGTCAVDAYDQKKADELLEVDGEDEFLIYMAPVGKE